MCAFVLVLTGRGTEVVSEEPCILFETEGQGLIGGGDADRERATRLKDWKPSV